MRPTKSTPARKFARQLSKSPLTPRLRKALANASPQNEHKDYVVHEAMLECLGKFIKSMRIHSKPLFDYEGQPQGPRTQARTYYQILGAWPFPDAAVFSPFKCAFEFDREGTGDSDFKTALMKAAGHVLSGAYQACVLFYILRRGATPHGYLGDGTVHTQRLIRTPRRYGLYVALVSKRSI